MPPRDTSGAPLRSDMGPFAIVPEWVLFGCQDAALRVYCILGRMANSDGICWPSISTLAERARMSKRTVIRAVQELEQLGAVVAERRTHEDGGNASTVYLVRYVQVTSVSPPGSRLSLGGGVDMSPPPVPVCHPPYKGRTKANRTKANKNEQFDTSNGVDMDGAFEVFWKTYQAMKPATSQVKATARNAWPKAVQVAGSAQVIMEGLERFAAYVQRVRRPDYCPIPMAATWLNQERWAAELPDPEAPAWTGSDAATFAAYALAVAAGNRGEPAGITDPKTVQAAQAIMDAARKAVQGFDPVATGKQFGDFLSTKDRGRLTAAALMTAYADQWLSVLAAIEDADRIRMEREARQAEQELAAAEYADYRRAFWARTLNSPAPGAAKAREDFEQWLAAKIRKRRAMSESAGKQLQDQAESTSGKADLFAEWMDDTLPGKIASLEDFISPEYAIVRAIRRPSPESSPATSE